MCRELEGIDIVKAYDGQLHASAWFRSNYSAFLVAHGKYRSTAGNQTLLWGYFKVHSRACMCDECVLAFAHAWGKMLPMKTIADAQVAKTVNLRHYGRTEDEIRTATNSGWTVKDIHKILPQLKQWRGYSAT
jgi:hypothetical protein